VMLLLLPCDINIKKDRRGRRTISLAAKGGHTEVVTLLLARHDVDLADEIGQTALSLAIMEGHTEVMMFLPSKVDVAVDSADNDGQTRARGSGDSTAGAA